MYVSEFFLSTVATYRPASSVAIFFGNNNGRNEQGRRAEEMSKRDKERFDGREPENTREEEWWSNNDDNDESAEANSFRGGERGRERERERERVKGSTWDRRLREFPVALHPRYLSCGRIGDTRQRERSQNVAQILELFHRAIVLAEKSRGISPDADLWVQLTALS